MRPHIGPPHRRRREGRILIELGALLVLTSAASLVGLRRLSGDGGMLRLEAHQVAVISDSWRGAARIVGTPGWVVHLPFVQRAHVMDKRPLEYVMSEGGDTAKLIVRASDGTSFWFDTVRVHYALDAGRAGLVLEDSGGSAEALEGVVDAYARAVLRDEFGSFTPEQIVEPDHRHSAQTRSRARLQRLLAPHGLLVLDLSVSKPGFAKVYESTLERRKTAEQDLERLLRKTELARSQRERRLELARRAAESEAVRAAHELELELAAARRRTDRRVEDADREFEDRSAKAEARFAACQAVAQVRVARIESEAAVRRERAAAIGALGGLAVREVLVQRLGEVEVVLEPFADAGGGER